MIVVGTMNIWWTRKRGDFSCPSCTATCGYRLRTRRPFLTLYFIPTLPIGDAELVVQCDGCREYWDESVLDLKKSRQEYLPDDLFREQAIRAAVMVVLVDDKQTENEKRVLQRVASLLLGRRMDLEELGKVCSIVRENRITAHNYVLTVSRRWDREQKSLALQAMFMVASSDGDLGTQQLQLLSRMREILEMEQSEYESAIESALNWD